MDPTDQRTEHADQQDEADADDRAHGDPHAHEGHRQGPRGVRGRTRPPRELRDESDYQQGQERLVAL